jgi:hypothetical protein
LASRIHIVRKRRRLDCDTAIGSAIERTGDVAQLTRNETTACAATNVSEINDDNKLA